MTSVLGVGLDQTSCSDAGARVIAWARRSESRYVCVANVHMLMEAFDSQAFCQVLNEADLVVPDGMPVVWMMRLKGQRDQERVYGPALMEAVLAQAALAGVPVGLLGSNEWALGRLKERLPRQHPRLQIVFGESPIVEGVGAVYSATIADRISESGARILFVGLGCPKQELWMAAHKGKIPAVMVGVGAAFDFLSGTKPQAPHWMQSAGLEWLFRLVTEPERLWRRYLIHSPRFLILAAAELLGIWRRQC